MENTSSNSITIIGKGTKFANGVLESSSEVNVSGYLKNSIKCDTRVIVTNDGYVEGDIRCTDLVISGRVKGNIYVKNSLTLKKTAVVLGTIHAGNLTIEEGASGIFDCIMDSQVNEEEFGEQEQKHISSDTSQSSNKKAAVE